MDRIVRLHRDPSVRAALAAAGRAWTATTFCKRTYYNRLEKIMQALKACNARR